MVCFKDRLSRYTGGLVLSANPFHFISCSKIRLLTSGLPISAIVDSISILIGCNQMDPSSGLARNVITADQFNGHSTQCADLLRGDRTLMYRVKKE